MHILSELGTHEKNLASRNKCSELIVNTRTRLTEESPNKKGRIRLNKDARQLDFEETLKDS